MDNAKNMHDEEEFHWTKGLIFTAIVLFPLIPFVLIYRHKFTRKTKMHQSIVSPLPIAMSQCVRVRLTRFTTQHPLKKTNSQLRMSIIIHLIAQLRLSTVRDL